MLVWVLLAVSCARDGGVILEVTPTSGEVDSIRLFIGTGDPTQNASLVVPVAKTANAITTAMVVPLTRWGRDANNDQDHALVSANETARFVLVKTETDTLGSIIAVGYHGSQPIEIATLFGLSLPGNTYKLYHLTLVAPAAPPVTWGPDLNVLPNEAVCIGYADPSQQREELSTAFIVTPGDQDCDGLLSREDGECNPDAWKGSRPANLDELTCLAIEPADSTCHLGGPICRDGLGKMPNECKPSEYCMPASVCERANTLDEAKDLTRVATALLPARYDCKIHVSNGALCQDHLSLPMYPNGGRDCTGVAISTAGQPFDNHFRLPGDTGEIAVKLDTKTCAVELAPSGKPPTAQLVGGIVAVDLDNGRGVAVPVILEIDTAGGCGADVVCTREPTLGDQQLADCATAIRPQLVNELVMPMGADDPTLTADMLEIWFNVGDKEIWHSSRASVLKPWNAPAIVPELTVIGAHTVNPHISPDGLTMFLGSDRNGTTGGYDVFKSRRSTRLEPWPLPDTVVELVSPGEEPSAAIDGTGTFLVMSKQLDMASGFDLYTAQRANPTLLWTNLTLAAPASTVRDDLNPHITKDGLEVWFTTTTPNYGLEIFLTQRTSLSAPFPIARRILELSSTFDDSDPWVSDGGHTVYFASTRVNGISQIFLAHR